ncbi:uncharacterized protein TRAVEDRAFT_20279 [Trametes versicolor FP-101664 SS1]|uniref:uncharacterized protein n=1 Tax=Trametes versicolor (strain FP-101664) TaxID=717944 RepID=UPI0004623A75|nr:uncharacterized protein TRAVEDRAFT_20279 [Trametes versicolor FP-101664 SS1]EIW58187.1 hypothetical protein TRAVEDRAFT_20279 [Trametes versicolor FP-101664 SS1]
MPSAQNSRSPTPTPAPRTRSATRATAAAGESAAGAVTPRMQTQTVAQPPPSQRLRAIQAALEKTKETTASQIDSGSNQGEPESGGIVPEQPDAAAATAAQGAEIGTPPGLPIPTSLFPSPAAPEGVEYDEIASEARTPPALPFWETADRTPMSPALSNFSIHGAGSVSSSCLADDVGDHLCSGGRLEDLVTDRVDRYGRPLPGYDELQQEQERKRKRLRTDGAEASPPNIVLRFRKYKDVPTPRTKAEKVANWVPFGHTPPSTSPAPKFVSAEVIHAEWLRKQAEESAQAPQPQDAQAGEPVAFPTSSQLPRGPPSPHLRDEDYAPLRHPVSGNLAYEDIPPRGAGDMEVDPEDLPADPVAHPPVAAAPRAAPARPPTAGEPRNEHTAGGGATAALVPAAPLVPSALRTRAQTAAGPAHASAPPDSPWGQDLRPSAWHDRGELPQVPSLRMVTPSPALAQPPAFVFTPKPRGGFPRIYFANPESLVEGLDPLRVDDLWEEGKRIILIGLFNIGYPKAGMNAPLTRLLTEALRQITKETDFAVIAPEPPWGLKPPPSKLPRVWAIEGLSDGSATKVVEGFVWSSKQLSFSAHKRELRLPELLITLGPYYQNYDNDIESSIQATFKSDLILPRIEDYVAENEDYKHLSTDDIAAVALTVANSVRVNLEEYTPGGFIASVFCASPCKESEEWLDWREYVKTVPFRTKYNPTRTARPTDTCGYCRGADHVTHTCPFPKVPGWNGPPVGSQMYGTPATPTPGAPTAHPANMGPSQTNTAPVFDGPARFHGQTPQHNPYQNEQPGRFPDQGWGEYEAQRNSRGRGGRGAMMGPPRGGYNTRGGGRGRGNGYGRPQHDDGSYQ